MTPPLAAVKMPMAASSKAGDDAGSSASYQARDMMDMKIVVRHKDLKEIVGDMPG